jgi:hypothetical protein
VPSDDVAAARARLRDSLVRFDDALAPAFDRRLGHGSLIVLDTHALVSADRKLRGHAHVDVVW